MEDKSKKEPYETQTFSKDNPIIETSSKQTTVEMQNIIPPARTKESKKE